MAQLSSLVAELKDLAQIQPSDGFLDITLQDYVLKALLQHNKALTVATLPLVEEEPVLTLAWVKVCLVRASNFAKASSASGGQGFGSDRDTPYTKEMDMAKALTARYSMLCDKLRLDGSVIVTGQIFVRDNLFDALSPLFQNRLGTSIMLTQVQTIGSSVVLHWDIENISDLREVTVISLVGDDPIYQEWNNHSATSIPLLNDSAVKLIAFRNFDVKSVKVDDVDFTQTNRFLIVVRDNANRYSYSNEILVSENVILLSAMRQIEVPIPAGQDFVDFDLTPYNLASTPKSAAILSVNKPQGGTNLLVGLVENSLSISGFRLEFSGAPDVDGYSVTVGLSF